MEETTGWKPIETAPKDTFVLVTAGGAPGGMEIAIAKLRLCLGTYQWQFLGHGVDGGPRYWLTLPEVV